METREPDTQARDFEIHPEAHIGHVHLRVSDIHQNLRYYRDLLGFKVLGEPSKENAFLSVDGLPPYLIALSKAAEPTSPQKHAGLYHFAILLPYRRSLASLLRHLMKQIEHSNIEGTADHGVSEALYMHDPDGNGIEIYHDRPRTEWRWSDGQILMTTQSLGEENLLNESKAPWKRMPTGTTIGHVHLSVSNLERASEFYVSALGLKHTSTYPSAYFYAADAYHHHVATNTWLGEGILSASHTQPGLDHFAIVLPSDEALHHLLRNLSWRSITTEKAPEEEFSHSVYIHDPDGIKIQLHIPDGPIVNHADNRKSRTIARNLGFSSMNEK